MKPVFSVVIPCYNEEEVLGETARADHFGLNGYTRDTTPALAKQWKPPQPMAG